jgi:hypothetical protein
MPLILPYCASLKLILNKLIEKADLMIDLHKTLQEISQKFQGNLLREFSLEKLNTKIENWYELTFADF